MIGRFVNGLAAVLGAGLLVQFPAFYQQYLQRLGGRLDQLQEDRARLLGDAQALGLSLQDYLAQLAQSAEAVARQSGLRETARLEQATSLEQAYLALSQAPALERPLALARHFDASVAESALSVYVPALPFSLEGLAYAGLGLVLAVLLVAGVEKSCRALFRRGRGRRPAEARKESPRHKPEPAERREPEARLPRIEEADDESHPAPRAGTAADERREPEFRST